MPLDDLLLKRHGGFCDRYIAGPNTTFIFLLFISSEINIQINYLIVSHPFIVMMITYPLINLKSVPNKEIIKCRQEGNVNSKSLILPIYLNNVNKRCECYFSPVILYVG